MTTPVWLLILLPVAGAMVLLLGGRATNAWGHLLGCPTMNDKVFDAIRAFRANYIDKGPETVP